MTTPVRIQLRRQKGFCLDEFSRSTNGLPARVVTRAGLFGNVFRVSETTPAIDAVASFGVFLRTWSKDTVINAAKHQDQTTSPIDGLILVRLRNRIRANLWKLRGHNLACFCPIDLPCHADVYLELMDSDLPEVWKEKYHVICDEVKR